MSTMVSAVIISHRYLDIKEYFPSETIQLVVERSSFKEIGVKNEDLRSREKSVSV